MYSKLSQYEARDKELLDDTLNMITRLDDNLSRDRDYLVALVVGALDYSTQSYCFLAATCLVFVLLISGTVYILLKIKQRCFEILILFFQVSTAQVEKYRSTCEGFLFIS